MCGKTNPGDLEVCQYCQARLKPLVVGAQPQAPLSPKGAEPDADIPEWLRALRPDPGFESVPENEPEELPDWLATDNKESSAEQTSSSSSTSTDWMTSLREESIQGKGELQATSQASGEGVAQEPAKADEIPDWLTGMRSESGDAFEAEGVEESSVHPFAPDETPESDPEWLKRISTPAEESPEESVSQKDEADFLTGLREQGERPIDIEPAEEAQPSLEEPNNLPDWLSDVGSTQETGQPEGTQDWLASQAPATEEVLAPEDNVPTWLAEYDETPQAVESPTSPVELGTKSLEPGAEVEAVPAPPPSTGVAQETSPDWLAGLASSKAVETSEGGVTKETPAMDVPDWLKSFAAASVVENVFSPETPGQAPDTTLDWLETQGEATAFQEESQAEATPSTEPEAVAPFTLEEEGLPLPLDQGDIPEWLGEPPGEEISSMSGAPPTEQGSDLAEAELPTWLSAMRPVEMAAPEAPVFEESDKPLEGSGPLAGLRSVLPGEYEVGKIKPPPSYTVKLQVSETQQAHASLVESLVKSEGEVGKVSARKVSGHQILIVVGIFALLLLAILWPVFTGSQDVGLPAYAPETVDTSSLVSSLPAKAPVLLAVDYEPGLAGEMEATANGVIDQLMLKGAYLTMVSTSPNGPAQAEKLIQSVDLNSGHTYQDISQYANLGYVPGGAAGLRSFAESPKRIMPYALNASGDQSVWDVPPLSSVNSLADFDMVAVITENPYTARTWIEQVQPLLGKTPLIMVLSAQAEPVVRPYYEGLPRQVQGFVAGLAGGAAYENMTGRLSTARKYWDAYSLGISVIAAILIIGGLVNLVLALISKQKPKAGEA